jgi:hypothetical protein
VGQGLGAIVVQTTLGLGVVVVVGVDSLDLVATIAVVVVPRRDATFAGFVIIYLVVVSDLDHGTLRLINLRLLLLLRSESSGSLCPEDFDLDLQLGV